jgi:VWFA-related protein
MRAVLSLLLLAAPLWAVPSRVNAQAGDITVTVEEVDTSASPSLRIRVSVRDQYGVPVQDLSAEHFEIVEDGAATSLPSTVEAETNPDAQVSLALVIDLYRTLQGEPIEAAQQATRDLLTDLLDEPNDEDRAAFVGVRQGVGTDPSEIDEAYDVPFTNDRNQLLNVINFLHERIQTSGPGTPLYDAVIKAIRMAEATEPVAHRAVIVMTDGEDRGSISTDGDTIQRASNARTPVFTVGLSNSGLDEAYLKRLAENSGGAYQAAETPDDFAPLFSNVLSTLRKQYVLTYDTGLPQDGQPHSLLVRVKTPTQLEGFQEYRVTMPGEVAPEPEEEEEPAPTAEAATPEPGADTESPPAEEETDEGGSAGIMDWIQDNLLLAGLAVGALALVFIALVIVAIIVMRKRRAQADQGYGPLEPPSYPVEEDYAFDVTPLETTDDSGGAGFGFGEPDFPQATMMDDEPAFGTVPAPDYGGPAPDFGAPPAQPAPFPPPGGQPPFQASTEDRTRIMQRSPKMSTVAMLIDRKNPAQRMDVAKPVVTIGRSQDSDLQVDHNTVSRQHAVIKLEDGEFRLYDMGSTNGTFVGDDRIREPIVLQDGSVVKFGERPFIFKIISLET